MALTIKEVEHVALLARLTLTEDEKEIFAPQLNTILDYVDKLNELNTDEVEPLTHILPLYNIYRDDVVEPSSPRAEILANAPVVEENQYKVPKIM